MIPRGLIPTPIEVGRETVTIVLGALLAAFIVGQLPIVRDWMRAQWNGVPNPVTS